MMNVLHTLIAMFIQWFFDMHPKSENHLKIGANRRGLFLNAENISLQLCDAFHTGGKTGQHT
jgi:hypothetical protein